MDAGNSTELAQRVNTQDGAAQGALVTTTLAFFFAGVSLSSFHATEIAHRGGRVRNSPEIQAQKTTDWRYSLRSALPIHSLWQYEVPDVPLASPSASLSWSAHYSQAVAPSKNSTRPPPCSKPASPARQQQQKKKKRTSRKVSTGATSRASTQARSTRASRDARSAEQSRSPAAMIASHWAESLPRSRRPKQPKRIDRAPNADRVDRYSDQHRSR